jgi:hypothetical protein
MTQDARELLEGPDQSIVVGIAVDPGCNGVTHALFEQIEARSRGIDGPEQIRLAEMLRRGLSKRRRLDDEDGGPLV